eukprot:superscaffoldBa00004348_g18728
MKRVKNERGGITGEEGEGPQAASPWQPETAGGVTLPSPPKCRSPPDSQRMYQREPEQNQSETAYYGVTHDGQSTNSAQKLSSGGQRPMWGGCGFEKTVWTADEPPPRGKGRRLFPPPEQQ